MIHVRRMSQPPELTWIVWDSAHPEAQVHCSLPRQEWEAAEHDAELVRQLVRATLLKAGEQVMAFVEQLEEL